MWYTLNQTNQSIDVKYKKIECYVYEIDVFKITITRLWFHPKNLSFYLSVISNPDNLIRWDFCQMLSQIKLSHSSAELNFLLSTNIHFHKSALITSISFLKFILNRTIVYLFLKQMKIRLNQHKMLIRHEIKYRLHIDMTLYNL